MNRPVAGDILFDVHAVSYDELFVAAGLEVAQRYGDIFDWRVANFTLQAGSGSPWWEASVVLDPPMDLSTVPMSTLRPMAPHWQTRG